MLQVLLYYGADPNALTSAGQTALMLAVINKSEIKTQALLLEAHTDLWIESPQRCGAVDRGPCLCAHLADVHELMALISSCEMVLVC